jgi:hypothetical protein
LKKPADCPATCRGGSASFEVHVEPPSIEQKRKVVLPTAHSLIEPLRRHVMPINSQCGVRFNEAEKVVRFPNGSNVYFGYLV